MLDIFEIQKQLVANAHTSGRERKSGEIIAKIAQPYADEIYFDALDNLIVRKKGRGKKIMMAAHMDTIGLLVTDIDENGFIIFDTLGGFWHYNLKGAHVRFENGVTGIIGKTNTEKDPKLSDLYIDIGSSSKQETEKLISIGDTCVYCGQPQKIQGGKIVGPYMDDLIGCSILLCALSQIKDNENDLYFVFTSQEEVGIRGAKTATYNIAPHYGFCIDVTGSGDYPEANKPKMPVSLGKGPAIKIKDGSVICNTQVVEMMKRAADNAKIEYQIDILRGSGTDAASIQQSMGGVLAGGISIACRYIHTPCEMVSLYDCEQCANLVVECTKTPLREII